jgi:hypothetical protein
MKELQTIKAKTFILVNRASSKEQNNKARLLFDVVVHELITPFIHFLNMNPISDFTLQNFLIYY